MRFCVLSSGSKGNSTYLEINNHKYLIDIGVNFLYLSKALKEIGVNPQEIEGVFITHIHEDHIGGLKKFLKEVNPTVYLSKVIYDNIKIDIDKTIFVYENPLDFVETIRLSHDTPECLGYIFNSNNKSLVYITDTGYINQKYFDLLSNKTAYILESNHDVDMLMNSSKPYFLKMRILGDVGHISNKDCLYYLKNFIGSNTKYIVLAHLSEDNNTEELALNNVKELDVENIIAARQNERSEVIEL